MAVGVSGANGGRGAARRIRDAAAPAKGREGRDRAGPARTAGGGVPQAATRREASVSDHASAARKKGRSLGSPGPLSRTLASTGASPRTPLCSCPRPGGATASGAEFPHWLSGRIYRLAPEWSSVVLLFLLPLVA